MTTVSRERAPGLSTNQVKILIVALALGVGVAVGLGLAQMLDLGGADATASYEGPMVERSQAMQANLNTIIDGGNAQLAAKAAASGVNITGNNLQRPSSTDTPTGDGSGASYSPMVERSLAMEQNHAALIAGGQAHGHYLGAAVGVYSGPMVERSLAMERNHSALIAGGLALLNYLD